MQIRIQNLGPLTDATIEPSNLTILAGTNNTGKTYAMYCLWAALNPPLKLEEKYSKLKFLKPMAKKLIDDKSITINIASILKEFEVQFDDFFSGRLTDFLPKLLNSNEVLLPKTSLSVVNYVTSFCDTHYKELLIKDWQLSHEIIDISVNGSDIIIKIKPFDQFYNFYSYIFDITEGEVVNEDKNKKNLENRAKEHYSHMLQTSILIEGLGDIIIKLLRTIATNYTHKMPGNFLFFQESWIEHNIQLTTFIPASRTGLNITYPDLMRIAAAKSRRERSKFGRNPRSETDILLEAQYTAPIDEYLTMLGYGHKASKGIAEDDLSEFLQNDIAKIHYEVDDHGHVRGKVGAEDSALPMHLLSSTSSNLYGVWLWLQFRHQHKNPTLMIDEPELNLHPENQRLFARFLVRLVNSGVRVIISTHSDYIVREINTMMMLNEHFPNRTQIEKEFGLDSKGRERIDKEKVKAYHFTTDGVVPCKIDRLGGIEVPSMNSSIDQMNELYDLVYAEIAEITEITEPK